MSAFQNGFLFLELEQYLAARQCFQAVVAEFPDCYEAWANLGYAQLMQYCDGLDADDLRQFGIGQIVAGRVLHPARFAGSQGARHRREALARRGQGAEQGAGAQARPGHAPRQPGRGVPGASRGQAPQGGEQVVPGGARALPEGPRAEKEPAGHRGGAGELRRGRPGPRRYREATDLKFKRARAMTRARGGVAAEQDAGRGDPL